VLIVYPFKLKHTDDFGLTAKDVGLAPPGEGLP
jgi:hypothetical protein